eukprot:CAMPEP_0170454962 /NCGR_PEP_ID=MMETSP0123-20130129/3051_1 /TAXON_ID=182087 /ORGANISM="Favella ehrenbergii, Strain Fehren 1" /LENGTH=110 /DNA_ID=CAMNT_0010717873 /DNA_START=355 /DNA_END=688 /DNA_ORIENTATION=+
MVYECGSAHRDVYDEVPGTGNYFFVPVFRLPDGVAVLRGAEQGNRQEQEAAADMHNMLAYEVGGYLALMGALYLVWVKDYEAWNYGMELTIEANKEPLPPIEELEPQNDQ